MTTSKIKKPSATPKKKIRPKKDEIDSRVILLEASSKVGESEVAQVVRDAKKIKKIAKNGALASFFDDILDLLAMVRDYANGTYREIPFGSIAAITGALLYVLSPIDLIPDFIPVVGYIDDAAVVAACLQLVQADVQKYKAKKNGA